MHLLLMISDWVLYSYKAACCFVSVLLFAFNVLIQEYVKPYFLPITEDYTASWQHPSGFAASGSLVLCHLYN